MADKSGGRAGGVTNRAGGANRFDYAGDGTRANPFQFTYFAATANYNAYGTAHNIIANQTEVGVRIRRIWLELDGTDATNLNSIAGIAAQVYSWAAGGAGTSNVVHLTPMGGFVRGGAPYGASVMWNFEPGGLVLIRPSILNINGAWDGNLTVQVIGYAATDEMRLYVEGEWWYL